MASITVVIPFEQQNQFSNTLRQFSQSSLVEKIYVVHAGGFERTDPKVECVKSTTFANGATVSQILSNTVTDHLLVVSQRGEIELGHGALERLVDVAAESGAGIAYSDCYAVKNGLKTEHSLIDYQLGSVRDNFDFGALMLLSCKPVKYAITKYGLSPDVQWSGWYDLRLKISIDANIFHLQEFLYSKSEFDEGKAESTMFDYLDPRNTGVQKELENVFTQHLKNVGAYLPPHFDDVPEPVGTFPVQASVVIPVRNRVHTIADAIKSALRQKTDFDFNVIVVDNHSTDGTSEVIEQLSRHEKRIVRVVPEKTGLSIGGCWNEAIASRRCGRYSVQLDSDDLYAGTDTLQTLTNMFRNDSYAAVIGSYKLVDLALKEIPPGVIDHREWTPENGRNNALRVNGFGAPRAFCTHLVRELRFPNVSYGEDYAVCLALSRKYRIGRIFDPMYLCRRWEGNTDARLTLEQANKNNFYKDRIRTVEILARQKINRKEDE